MFSPEFKLTWTDDVGVFGDRRGAGDAFV
jgi:hypothetical protein